MALPSLRYHFKINQLGFLHLLSLMSSDFLPQDELKHCSVLAPQPWLKKHRHRQATRLSTSSFLSLSTAKTPFLALVKYTGKWPTAPLSHSLYTCLRNKPGAPTVWMWFIALSFYSHLRRKMDPLGGKTWWTNVNSYLKLPRQTVELTQLGRKNDAGNLQPLCIFVEVKGPSNL